MDVKTAQAVKLYVLLFPSTTSMSRFSVAVVSGHLFVPQVSFTFSAVSIKGSSIFYLFFFEAWCGTCMCGTVHNITLYIRGPSPIFHSISSCLFSAPSTPASRTETNGPTTTFFFSFYHPTNGCRRTTTHTHTCYMYIIVKYYVWAFKILK